MTHFASGPASRSPPAMPAPPGPAPSSAPGREAEGWIPASGFPQCSSTCGGRRSAPRRSPVWAASASYYIAYKLVMEQGGPPANRRCPETGGEGRQHRRETDPVVLAPTGRAFHTRPLRPMTRMNTMVTTALICIAVRLFSSQTWLLTATITRHHVAGTFKRTLIGGLLALSCRRPRPDPAVLPDPGGAGGGCGYRGRGTVSASRRFWSGPSPPEAVRRWRLVSPTFSGPAGPTRL